MLGAAGGLETGRLRLGAAVGNSSPPWNHMGYSKWSLEPLGLVRVLLKPAWLRWGGRSSCSSLLCLGGAIGRYVGPGQIQNSGSAGAISLAIDNTQVPQPTGFVTIAAGETWSFQAWHRDAVAGSATSNFTAGYEITFN